MLSEAMLLEQNKRLREENEELRETVRQLRTLQDQNQLPDALPQLTNLESRVLRVLLSRPGIRTHEFILDSLYCDADQREPNIVKVMVSRLRRKIGHIVKIETVWGRGYIATLVNDTLTAQVEAGVSSNSERQAA